MSVPLIILNRDEFGLPETSLCFEIRGASSQYFNLLSDKCISVNVHYVAANRYINVIDSVTIRAVDNEGNCLNIGIHSPTCSPSVNGRDLVGPYFTNGISITSNGGKVRISTPNCTATNIVIWAMCQSSLVMNPVSGKAQTKNTIRVTVAHGASLHASSHGLIGK